MLAKLKSKVPSSDIGMVSPRVNEDEPWVLRGAGHSPPQERAIDLFEKESLPYNNVSEQCSSFTQRSTGSIDQV
ncbi:hypothetical protein NPIL_51611 [Nephila pilipes]|uniref:Uncharacterized protein n=1 Tax=Nephila pilipes TaxID=299642 RepID=A0A8X6Q3B9_NEPPI|nr:hypothetical protein NPIL_51611 [Nephila pilipes]